MEPGTGFGTDYPWKPAPLFLALREFARTKPVMGTCAGLIMLARPCGDERVVSLDVLPVTVERNAYGRQTESFVADIEMDLPPFVRSSGAATPAVPTDAPYPATLHCLSLRRMHW